MSSELFDGVFGTTAVVAATDDRALVGALCEVETALARAAAQVGLVPLAVALEIGAVCDAVARLDPAELGRRAATGANPVIPLVTELRARVEVRAGAEAARAVHLGATSQDVMDTAFVLVASRAAGIVLADLDDAAQLAAGLARTHRDTAMIGRTLLQAAVPTTFGLVAAGWGAELDNAISALERARAALPVQYGGAAGTRAAVHPHGAALAGALADELDLLDPGRVWHGDRGPLLALAAALALGAHAVAKIAGDVVLLAQTELGEVHEAAPGGSSAMAHKRNPVAAVTARAAAAQVPGLLATLFAATPELQRGAGPWHAEWPALVSLLRHAGGAAARLRTCLTGLQVDAEAMGRGLDRVADTVDVTGTGHAGDLVDAYLAARTRPVTTDKETRP